jgi:hypothetical protein
MADLRLAELTEDTINAAIGLELRPGQERLMAPVVRFLAEAPPPRRISESRC